MNIKSLTIYCSSSKNLSQELYKLGEDIGIFLGQKKITIIYGGGNIGLMGKVSNSAIKQDSKVIGIIPEFLQINENVSHNISQTIIVKTMSERKKILFDKGDAFLLLPGGSGTIEEITEIISWKILKLHNKPIIIFNYKDYWKSLFEVYDNAKKLNFGNQNLQSISIVVDSLKKFKSLFNQ